MYSVASTSHVAAACQAAVQRFLALHAHFIDMLHASHICSISPFSSSKIKSPQRCRCVLHVVCFPCVTSRHECFCTITCSAETLRVQVQEKLDAFANRYYVLKAPRKLLWQPHLGTVSLTLTVGGTVHDFTVPPILASMLLHFQVPSLCHQLHLCSLLVPSSIAAVLQML